MQALYELENYSGLMTVYNVIYSAEVFRLKASIRDALFKYKDVLRAVDTLQREDFTGYWNRMKNRADGPALPILGLYSRFVAQKKLVFTHGDTINYDQCLKMFDKVRGFVQLQNRTYNLKPEPKIREFLMDLCPYEKKTRAEFMSDLYERSLRIEATSPSDGAACGVCQRSTSYDLNVTLDSQVSKVRCEERFVLF
eukprot:sb/3470904/